MTTAVIGAGIIGTTLAYALRKRGRDVVLIERDGPVDAVDRTDINAGGVTGTVAGFGDYVDHPILFVNGGGRPPRVRARL